MQSPLLSGTGISNASSFHAISSIGCRSNAGAAVSTLAGVAAVLLPLAGTPMPATIVARSRERVNEERNRPHLAGWLDAFAPPDEFLLRMTKNTVISKQGHNLNRDANFQGIGNGKEGKETVSTESMSSSSSLMKIMRYGSALLRIVRRSCQNIPSHLLPGTVARHSCSTACDDRTHPKRGWWEGRPR